MSLLKYFFVNFPFQYLLYYSKICVYIMLAKVFVYILAKYDHAIPQHFKLKLLLWKAL